MYSKDILYDLAGELTVDGTNIGTSATVSNLQPMGNCNFYIISQYFDRHLSSICCFKLFKCFTSLKLLCQFLLNFACMTIRTVTFIVTNCGTGSLLY